MNKGVYSEFIAHTMTGIPDTGSKHYCYHCGEDCEGSELHFDDKVFCCTGCQTVYEILKGNDMCTFYDLDEVAAGLTQKGKTSKFYAFLDEPEVVQKLVEFTDGDRTRVNLHLPGVHCSSCIWLLENLHRLDQGILQSKVNFLQKELDVTFKASETSLRRIAELLDRLGYTPAIQLDSLDRPIKKVVDRKFLYKLGIAGFAFGNVMLLSFPEYLGLDETVDHAYYYWFGYLNILISLPVLLYSARDYMVSAWEGLKLGQLNLDVPITLGIVTLFGRSVYDILAETGAGYLDSFTGLIFFLLTGKWFQQATYFNISFDRDYKSYFPIAATRLGKRDEEQSITLDKLEVGDRILVRSNELIPADGTLVGGKGSIDYSFVSGEAVPVERKVGDYIYAGGRQTGEPIQLVITRRVSQSYLTQLWNDEAFTKRRELQASGLADRVSKYFTLVILGIALAALLYWMGKDVDKAINAFTSVLIIACPCAVALSIPFTFGNVLRLLGNQQLFLKNTAVIEALAKVDTIVFDKTGTLTISGDTGIAYRGKELSQREQGYFSSLAGMSNHPVSRALSGWLAGVPKFSGVEGFEEFAGRGIRAYAEGKILRIGSAAFFREEGLSVSGLEGTLLGIDDNVLGSFELMNAYRSGLEEVVQYFKDKGELYLLSGDNDREADRLRPLFGGDHFLKFNQSPVDKLEFVRKLQQEGRHVLMIGDGLNDAGALQQSEVGLVVTEDANNFTPASDGVLKADRFGRLPAFMEFSRKSIFLIYWAYGLAFIYNMIGLSYAVQGELSPVIAAILMPLSSVTIVVFGLLSSTALARRSGIDKSHP